MDRPFVVLEGSNGDRNLVHLKEDGNYTLWENYQPYHNPNAPKLKDFEVGKQYNMGKDTYTMRDATTSEIERHALGNDNKPMDNEL